MNPLDEAIKRLEACEARQRDYQMHDPDCPARSDSYTKCTCWLSRPPQPFGPTPIFDTYKTTIGDGNKRSFVIKHNLGSNELYKGTKELRVSLRKTDTDLELMGTEFAPSVWFEDLNTMEILFPASQPPPEPDSIQVLIIPMEKLK